MNELHNPTLRVINIINNLALEENGYTFSELVKITGIPRGTLFPILKTLTEFNYIEFDKITNKYQIGVEIFLNGTIYRHKNTALELIKGQLELISQKCKETCHLGILKGKGLLYLLKIESKESIVLPSIVGKSLPANATALGKANLSGLSNKELEVLFKDGLDSINDNTIVDLDVLKKEIAEIKKTGFAYEYCESSMYAECIAIPIKKNDKVIAAVSVTIPTFRSNEEKREEIKKLLLFHKKKIEVILKNFDLF